MLSFSIKWVKFIVFVGANTVSLLQGKTTSQMALYRIYVVNTMLSVVKNMNGSLFSISGMYSGLSVLCDIPGSGLGTRPKLLAILLEQ